MWTAVAALWRYRSEVQYQRTSASREGYLAWWDGELRQWGQEGAVAVPAASMQRARRTIRAKLERREDTGIPAELNKNKAQEERKQHSTQEVIERYNLQPPREGVQRVWTDGSQQEGEHGQQYAGYGAWFGEGHTLHCYAPLGGSIHTNNRAELTAAIEVLRLVPTTAEIQLCADWQLVMRMEPRYA